MLNRVDEELPSSSDVAKADDIELQEIMENTARSMEDLITQFSGPQGDLLKHFFGVGQGAEEHLRFAQVGNGKKVQLQQHIKREKHKLVEIRDNSKYHDGI